MIDNTVKKYLDPKIVVLFSALGVNCEDFKKIFLVEENVPDDATGAYQKVVDIIYIRDVQTSISTPNTTSLHELIHWTGHRERLERPNMYMGNTINHYATEEVTAQYGMHKLSKILGIDADKSDQFLERYIRNYLPFADVDKAIHDADVAANYVLEKLHSSGMPLDAFSKAASSEKCSIAASNI